MFSNRKHQEQIGRLCLYFFFSIMLLCNVHFGYGQGAKEKTIRIAGVQINSAADINASLQKALTYIKQASRENADFIIFPEMYLTGYHNRFDEDEAEAALTKISKAAKEYKINILMGTGSKHLGVTTNQVRIYSRKGELVGFHDKILLAGPEQNKFEPGSKLRVFDLEGICFAVLICNDFWATPQSTHGRIPLLVQDAQNMGASIIFHSMSCSGEKDIAKRTILADWHVANHRTWAMRIGIAVVAADQPKQLGSLVNSGIIGMDGNYIVKAPNLGEHFFVGEIYLPESE